MGRPGLTVADRARGGLLGLAAGAVRAGDPAARGELALAAAFAEELLETAPDLHRLVGRWIAWWRQDGAGLTDRTAAALDHLARLDAPLTAGPPAAEAAPLVRAFPVALASFAQPRNLVSATWHAVMLTHPDPHTAWSAVAVNVAAARFMQGRRDFVPDAIEVLTANDAPGELLATVRRLPFASRAECRPDRPVEGPAVAAAGAALWAAYHEPVFERGVTWLADAPGDTTVTTALGGALLGVRDGERAIPHAWLAGVAEVERWREVGRRLGRAGPPAA
jgi:ADP-ribosylglycohydrolase